MQKVTLLIIMAILFQKEISNLTIRNRLTEAIPTTTGKVYTRLRKIFLWSTRKMGGFKIAIPLLFHQQENIVLNQ